ncbi:MAG: NAD-dependent protein deacylase [Clostridiaceae bacterium]|nr:NAD-dependent protein deacylase [Clostridiaceae bacterium]
MEDERIRTLKDMLDSSEYVVFFGGAGVSTDSNIPDFRSEDGIYKTLTKYGRSPEELLSHTFFMAHPGEFFEYYRNNLIFADVRPNRAHLALAELEKRGILKSVVTQNIDGLHQMAGSREVQELHGSVFRNYCMKCGEKYGLEYVVNYPETVPKCQKCGGIVRPDVVLYEEGLDMRVLSKAAAHIRKADMLIVGGTSLAVYPAAGLIDYYSGSRLVLINKSSTPYDRRADLVINDSIGKVLGEAVFGQ